MDKLEFTNQLHVSVARLVFEELSRDDEKMKTMREKNGTIKPIICPKAFWPPPTPREIGVSIMCHIQLINGGFLAKNFKT